MWTHSVRSHSINCRTVKISFFWYCSSLVVLLRSRNITSLSFVQMVLSVTVLLLVVNLALGAPFPFPQEVVTTTLTEPELASLFPILDFFPTPVLDNPTSIASIFSSSSTSSDIVSSPSTSQLVIPTSTSSTQQQQESDSLASANNGNVQADVTRGPVTFGELTTPSEGGTFNKFVASANEANSSTTEEENATPPGDWHSSVASLSASVTSTLTLQAASTRIASVHFSSTKVVIAGTSLSSPVHSLKKNSTTAYYKQSPGLAGVVRYKRLFPSLFRDYEGFDRFDVPGSSNRNQNGKNSESFLPPNIVPPGISLFASPSPSSPPSPPLESNKKDPDSDKIFSKGDEKNAPQDVSSSNSTDTPVDFSSGLIIPPSPNEFPPKPFSGSSPPSGHPFLPPGLPFPESSQ